MNTHRRVTVDTNNNINTNDNIKNNFNGTTTVINSRQRTIQYTTLSFSSRFQVSLFIIIKQHLFKSLYIYI